jgi:hypothetical protein
MADIYLYGGAANLNDIILGVQVASSGGVRHYPSRSQKELEKAYRRHEEEWRRATLDAKQAVDDLTSKIRQAKTPAKPKKALKAATEVAQEAIVQAGILAEFAPQLGPLTEALQAATKASPAEMMARAAEIIRVAESILQAMEEEDEEESIMMLLS